MSQDPHDQLLETDWAELWDTLPDAPALRPRPAMAQMTLRLPAGLRARIRRVAATRGLPYHALARSWVIDGLRDVAEPELPAHPVPQPEQRNLKLDQESLDTLKQRAHQMGRPYHSLAREFIETALAHEEQKLGIAAASRQPPIKDLMVLLLHARNTHGQDAVHGITRMQKLLFVLEQTLVPQSRTFYAYNYGPFSEGVNDAAESLRLAGLLAGSQRPGKGPPSFAEMMDSAKRTSPVETTSNETFALNKSGHDAAERLRRSDSAHGKLFDQVSKLREEWDTPDLVERVYEAWPEQTKNSLIRDEVAERRRQRQKR